MDGIADEDGWIKVTRHGRNKAAQRTENQQKKVLARDRKKRKQKVRFFFHCARKIFNKFNYFTEFKYFLSKNIPFVSMHQCCPLLLIL